mgnify:CR=1 FL=1
MENVKEFAEYLIKMECAPAGDLYSDPWFKAIDYANKIANKLLLIPTKEMRVAYGRMIINAMETFTTLITVDEFNSIKEKERFKLIKGLIQSEKMGPRFLFTVSTFLNFRHCDINLCELVSDIKNSRFVYIDVAPELIIDIIPSVKNTKNEFNLYRKKEAIITMLEALGVKGKSAGAVPDSNIKKFVYFLTGSGTTDDDIRNQYVSDLFKPSKDNRNNETINKDLDFVAARFEEIGLFNLAQKVKNGKI